MILGIDEVGRGSLAGPLVVGAVSLAANIHGLKDSKLLSATKRTKLNKLIIEAAELVKLGWVWPEEIDSLGLTNATKVAIQRALNGIDVSKFQIIIDGNINYLPDLDNVTCLIKADSKIPSVSAASIVAKVARDEYMHKVSKEYPNYNFDLNVGYGTKQHIQAISEYGQCLIHRKSFKLAKELFN